MSGPESLSTSRLYGAIIAVVSGTYSVYLSVSGVSMTVGRWFMLALGAVVIVHGIVLLTPAAVRLGNASGPLMIGYSVLMLLNQFRLVIGWGDTSGMDSAMSDPSMMDSTASTTIMGADAGMIAIAVLMFASGLIMTVRHEMMAMETSDRASPDRRNE